MKLARDKAIKPLDLDHVEVLPVKDKAGVLEFAKVA